MPEQRAGNGLATFSLHAYSDATSDTVGRLHEELTATPTLVSEVSDGAGVDPETAARQLLRQALRSSAVQELSAPVVGGTESRFRTIDTETVPLTNTRVVKFRQTVHDIPVYGSLVTVELDQDNGLVSLDSSIGSPEGVDPVAGISPAQATTAADAAPDGYTPTLSGVVPQLNYYFDAGNDTWRLVYILSDVPVRLDRDAEPEGEGDSDLEPPRFVDYVVDAHDGTVVAVLPRTPSADGPEEQTAPDAFGVKRTFVASHEGSAFVLFDPGHNVRTYDFAFGDPSADADRLPGTAMANPPDWTPAAVSAHANAVAVSDFLRTVLVRDNIDNRGGVMSSSVNCVVADASPGNNEWVNAFWNGNQMVYGQVLREGGLLLSLAANVDVVGHEMFHGVTDHTSRLEYVFQSGALNESFSDIFGTIIANWGNDDTRTWDWLLGERLLPGDKPFRDLSDPPRFGQPGHMDDFRILPNTRRGDWGGVHVNSGIHNKAAFLVLTAENEDGSLTLTPKEAAAVFYLALTQRLSRTSQFADSRRAAVASARTLFRTLPAADQQRKVQAVDGAFEAVGIR